MCSYLWRQQECYSDNLIKLPIMSAGIWLQNGSFYKHHYFYDWQKYARSGANSFTNTYFTTCVVNCLQVRNSKMLKVYAQSIKNGSSYKDFIDSALLPVSHPCTFTSVRGVTPNIYINLHLNQAISCIQYWTWDYTSV